MVSIFKDTQVSSLCKFENHWSNVSHFAFILLLIDSVLNTWPRLGQSDLSFGILELGLEDKHDYYSATFELYMTWTCKFRNGWQPCSVMSQLKNWGNQYVFLDQTVVAQRETAMKHNMREFPSFATAIQPSGIVFKPLKSVNQPNTFPKVLLLFEIVSTAFLLLQLMEF